MPGLAPLCAGECAPVIALRFIYQLGKLRIGLSQDERAVMGDVRLPERLGHEGLALAAARRPAVKRLILKTGQEVRLPPLRRPQNHVSPFSSFPAISRP